MPNVSNFLIELNLDISVLIKSAAFLQNMEQKPSKIVKLIPCDYHTFDSIYEVKQIKLQN